MDFGKRTQPTLAVAPTLGWRRARPIVAVTAVVAALGLGAALLSEPAGAGAKKVTTWKASITDPVDVEGYPNLDFTKLEVRYRSDGTLRFALTMAEPIETAVSDSPVVGQWDVLIDKPKYKGKCKISMGGRGIIYSPTPFGDPPANSTGFAGKFVCATVTKTYGTPVIDGRTYTLEVKDASLKNRVPGCIAQVLIGDHYGPPGENEDSPFEVTDNEDNADSKKKACFKKQR